MEELPIIFLLERIRGLRQEKTQLSQRQAQIDFSIREIQLKIDLIVQKEMERLTTEVVTE